MEKLTTKEEEIMQILWQMERAFVKEIVAGFPSPKPHYNTISTTIRKMEDKGFVKHQAFGKTHQYYPPISKETYREHFIKKTISNYLLVSTLAMFFFTFRVKTVYANIANKISITEHLKTVSKNNDDIIISIDKNATNKELKACKNQLNEAGITCTFSSVKRNISGEIVVIAIKLKDTGSSQKRAIAISNSGKSITRILLGMKAGKLFIGLSEIKEKYFVLSEGEVKNNQSNRTTKLSEDIKKALYIVDGEMTDVTTISLNRLNIQKIQIYKGEKAITLYGEKAKKGVIIITIKKKDTDKKENYLSGHISCASFSTSKNVIKDTLPLYIINGKMIEKSTSNTLNINTDDIVKVNIIKGPEAVAKYGGRAANGIYMITTKDKELIAQLDKKSHQKNETLSANNIIISADLLISSRKGFLKYNDKIYYYTINKKKKVFYDRYGAILTDKKIIRKLKRML